MKRLTVFLPLLLLAPGAAGAQTVAQGKTAFQVCAACHGTKPGEKRMGPSLAGVAGKKAGKVAGYNYSPALAKGDIVWTDAKLAEFLADPKKAAPGTKMIFRGVTDPAKRAAIVAFLKSLPAS